MTSLSLASAPEIGMGPALPSSAVAVDQTVSRRSRGSMLPAEWTSLAGPLMLLLVTLVAFWRSVAATMPLLGMDTAAGLAPVVPLLAVWLSMATNRRRARAGRPLTGAREGALDVPAAALLLGASAWLVWFAPGQDGWYFWSQRLDLLAAGLFALGVAVLAWGVQTLWWHRLAAVYALLVWPEPLVRLQDLVAPPLALVTALVARPLALAAGAHLAPLDGGNPAMFSTPAWTMLVGDVCSGLNAGLAVGLVCVPAAAWLGLPWRRAIPWALGGLGLALLSNLVRVTALLVVADRVGPDFALGTLHPILGALLLSLVFVVLWLRAPSCVAEGAHQPRTLRATRVAGGRHLLALAALVGVFAVGSARVAAFAGLPPVGPPGGSVSEPLDYLRLPPGWAIVGEDILAWQNLFGPDSHSYALTLRSPEGALVKAQVVTTPDQSRLDTYGLEACRVYHGEDVVGRRTVDLGGGGVASLIDTLDQAPVDPAGRISLVYWEAPFLLDGRLEHARVAFFLVQGDEGGIAQAATGLAPGGASFDAADGLLVSLARDVASAILAA